MITSNDLLSELSNTYSSIPSAFSPKKLDTAYSGLIAGTQATGLQVANDAGDEYTNRAMQAGGSTLGSGVAKAQSFLPFLQQMGNLKVGQAQADTDLAGKAIGLQADLAKSLADIRMQYTNTLASQALQGRQLDIQQQANDRNFTLGDRAQRIQVGEFNASLPKSPYQTTTWGIPAHLA